MGALCLLLALFFILEEESFSLPLFLGPQLTGRSSHTQRPCPMAALGVWSTFLDPCTLPMVRRWGGQLRTQFTSHEGNGDIAHFLYSEGPRGSFFFDESGPTCLVRAFFAVGFGSLTFDVHTGTPPAQVHLAVLGIEVDGVLVLNASIQELFMGREWEAGSSFLPSQAPSPSALMGGEEGYGGEDRYPAFPSTHNFALERGREGTLHSGWLLQTPICAKDRLRLSLSYPGIAHMYWAPDLLTQQSAICTAQYEKCPVAQYFNVHALRFPGAHLPDQWEAFDSAHTPSVSPALLHDLGLPSTIKGVLSAARVLEKAVSEAGPGSTGVRKGFLGKGGSPLTIFSSTHGAGVVTSISLDFPGERHLLHSRSIRLVAVWDGGEAVGLSPRKKGSGGGVGGGLSGEGAPEPYTAWGWSDWDNKRGGGNTTVPPSPTHSTPAHKGGVLEFDLEGILGPLTMGEEGPRADPSATHVNCRKELYLVGEMPAEGGLSHSSSSSSTASGKEGGDDPRGFYFTIPAPFWHSATIQLFYDAVEGESVNDMAPQTEVVYRVTTAPNPHFYVEGVAGYLQGGTESLVMEEGMRGNVLAEVRGTRGSLVLVAAHVVGATQQFVEGDLRVWTDGSPSPNVWESGWEDFFNGSHGYDEDLHHCGEAMFSYDRVDPLYWGWYNNSHTTVHFFQVRLLMGDAVTFEDSFRMAVEGLPVKYKGTVRALTLWYGYPTSAPLHTSDWVYPGEEWEPSQLVVLGGYDGGGGASEGAPSSAAISDALHGRGAFLPSPLHPHGYALVAPASTSLSRYSLTSGLPSYGEWVKIVLLKCFRKKQCEHEGAGGGVSVTVEGALAVEEGWVSFTVAVDPGAERVFLRRLVDIRYGVQRVSLRVDGVDCGAVGSSDREYLHMHTSWKVDTVRLPPEVTQGKSSLRITLQVLPEDVKGRVFPEFSNLGWGWTEARWEVVNVPHLL
jgi:hypothetical protein